MSITRVHITLALGHLGVRRMQKILARCCWWPAKVVEVDLDLTQTFAHR